MSNPFIEPIVAKLQARRDELKAMFERSNRDCCARYFAIDGLLPEDIARKIYAEFPKPEQMRLTESFREKKFTSKNLDAFSPILKDITFAVQDPRVIHLVEEITGIEAQEPDPMLYAGGLSLMTRGQFLNPHLDNSHDSERARYRTVNLLYYVTPDWTTECGGHLELWDENVTKPTVIESRFNRLVVMETNRRSWHSVNQVRIDGQRCCVSNYYFSKRSPEREDYFHVTSYAGRPGDTMGRLRAKMDNSLRMLVRKIRPGGFGKRDLYTGATTQGS